METRRGLLKKTLGGAALLAVAGAVPIALRGTRLRPVPRPLRFFTPAEYAVFAAVADRILATDAAAPPSADVRIGARPRPPSPEDVGVAAKADAFLAGVDAKSAADFKQLLALLDNGLFSFVGGGPPRPFTRMTADEQDRTLLSWSRSRLAVKRTGFQALKRLTAAVYFGSPETWASLGYPGPPYELVRSVNAAREK
jgi:Gluconate 2-dehydrogenase subunit 3